MKQDLSFYLTIVFLQDDKTGDTTAFFAQFPEATAQGRTQDEAQKLLFEVFPYMLKDKGEEFKQYHKGDTEHMRFTDQFVRG